MRLSFLMIGAALIATPALADEPDGLTLPPGFHASVVADGLGPVRHMAIRANGDIYVSTLRPRVGMGPGIIALHLDAGHKADQTEHFGLVDGGTAIRFYKDALYAASPLRVYRFTFKGQSLLPENDPTVIVDHITAQTTLTHGIAFDNKGDMFLSVEGTGNICTAPNTPAGATPVGLQPCPDLAVRAGIWRFSATKPDQNFSTGEHFATGIRDSEAMDVAPDGSLYAIMHGRDTTARQFPKAVTQADDDNIADEMEKIAKGTDFGWPYTYWDGARKERLVAPEYGGDGKTVASGSYATPVAAFYGRRAAPLDLLFYRGKNFPAQYRGGAFIAFHAGGGQKIEGGTTGNNIVFMPMGADGKLGAPQVFADGFSGPTKTGRATYRPVGEAIGPDGALYVADSAKGRIWRIAYEGG